MRGFAGPDPVAPAGESENLSIEACQTWREDGRPAFTPEGLSVSPAAMGRIDPGAWDVVEHAYGQPHIEQPPTEGCRIPGHCNHSGLHGHSPLLVI
jgi:hypothetical protein